MHTYVYSLRMCFILCFIVRFIKVILEHVCVHNSTNFECFEFLFAFSMRETKFSLEM